MTTRPYRLEEICTFIKGTYPIMKTEPGQFPLVVSASFRRSASSYQIEGRAVCIPLISSTGHGDAALHRVHYQEGRFALANLLVALLPRTPAAYCPKYLYYLLNAKKDSLFVPLMQGTANVSLKIEDIAGVEVFLPPLTEQRRIVARIEELAGKLGRARSIRDASKSCADALPSRERHRAFSGLARTCGAAVLGDLITEAGYGTSVKCTEGRSQLSMPILRIPNVIAGALDLRGLKYAALSAGEQTKVRLMPGDLLVVRTNGSADLVGRCAVVGRLPEPMGFASYLIRIRCDTRAVDPEYLRTALADLRSNGALFDLARTTAGQYNVSLGRLRGSQFPLPPLPEQRRIVAYLDDLQAKVDALMALQEKTTAELDALMPSILDRAFRGEL